MLSLSNKTLISISVLSSLSFLSLESSSESFSFRNFFIFANEPIVSVNAMAVDSLRPSSFAVFSAVDRFMLIDSNLLFDDLPESRRFAVTGGRYLDDTFASFFHFCEIDFRLLITESFLDIMDD